LQANITKAERYAKLQKDKEQLFIKSLKQLFV